MKTGIYTYTLNRDENLILLRAGLFPRCNFSAIGFSLDSTIVSYIDYDKRKVFHIQQGGEEKAAIISVHSNSIHARTKPRASFSFLFSRGEFLELPFIVALIIILKRITRVLDFGA